MSDKYITVTQGSDPILKQLGIKEVDARLTYHYYKTNGTYQLPNNNEGRLLELVIQTLPPRHTVAVDKGALQMAINVLEREGKSDIVKALKDGCTEL